MSSIGALLLKKQSKKREKRLKGGFETKKKNIFIKIWKKVLTTKNVCDKIVNCIIIARIVDSRILGCNLISNKLHKNKG